MMSTLKQRSRSVENDVNIEQNTDRDQSKIMMSTSNTTQFKISQKYWCQHKTQHRSGSVKNNDVNIKHNTDQDQSKIIIIMINFIYNDVNIKHSTDWDQSKNNVNIKRKHRSRSVKNNVNIKHNTDRDQSKIMSTSNTTQIKISQK